MYIKLLELNTKPAKYFDLAKTCEIIVTRYGQSIGRILTEENATKQEKLKVFDELMQLVKTKSSVPDNTIYDVNTEDRLKYKGLI